MIKFRIGGARTVFERKKASLKTQLAEPWRYRRQIERLREKRANRLHEPVQEGVSLSSILMDIDHFSRVMARCVSMGEYQVGEAQSRMVRIGTKERELFAFSLTDLIVHGVIAELILERMRDDFSPNLFSYLPGKNWWKAVSAFARFIRIHRKSIPNPMHRGLYVLRRDIRKYTDTIPVDDSSPLWPQLAGILGLEFPVAEAPQKNLWKLIQDVIRPSVRVSGTGTALKRDRGVPTGSPISTTLFNVYLHPVDRKLETIAGGYYARYADDLIFAHPDARVAHEASEILDSELQSLRLSVNATKGLSLFFNGAGRSSPDQEWQGTNRIPFLGCSVDFSGTIALSDEKCHDLMTDLKSRSRAILKHTGDRCRTGQINLVCATVNEALEPTSINPHKVAILLRNAVTDRNQLADLDYRVALMIAELLSGHRGPRAFRHVSIERLRTRHGLLSLLHQRNRCSR